ncbi:MAG: Z1 domain-containing protein [Candidatus Saccharimonadales bacterium]
MANFEEAAAVDPVFSDKGLSDIERGLGIKVFSDITDEIIKAYDNASKDAVPTGLIYGRIQSGKTRTMILTTAMAIDRKFKVILVLTSNNNDLVQQTYDDFKKGLPGVKVISKAELNDMDGEVELLKNTLRRDENSVVIVCSKGQNILDKVITFLKAINAHELASLIFDDEGDQATLDTNIGRRSRTGNDIAPSKIFSLIHSEELRSLRMALKKTIFVSVTGTPQALFLQNLDSASRPTFIKIIQPGKGYVGGDVFFSTPNPGSNRYISIVDEDEMITLQEENDEIPEGLIAAIDFFVMSATIAGLEKGWDVYNMLAHPSLNRFDHGLVKQKIISYINNLLDILADPSHTGHSTKLAALRRVYDEVNGRSTKKPEYTFEQSIDTIKRTLPQRQVFVLNSDRRGPAQSPSRSYNFLIGGNSVGRGIAIKNLLVTYYTRSPRTARMDTMHQHARMFGYRQKTLQFTKLYLPITLYARFYWIYKSDSEMRDFILKYGDKLNLIIVPTNRSEGLRPTRSNVIDMSSVDIIIPGSQVHPGRPIFEPPQANVIRKRTQKLLFELFPGYKDPDAGRAGIEITTNQAIKLITTIKSHPLASRGDRLFCDYLRSLEQNYGPKVLLRYREAPKRTNPSGGGALPNGIISGAEQDTARKKSMPTLWVFLVGNKTKSEWAGVEFIYPTLISPNQEQSLYGNIS